MHNQNNPLADRLLGRVPTPSEIAQYRESIRVSLEEERKKLRIQRVATHAFWISCAVLAVAWMWFSADTAHLPRGPFLAGLFLICGGVEVIKHAVNAGRFETLKAIKQLQLQVFELEQKMQSTAPGAKS